MASSDGFLLNGDDGLAGVVLLVCLACVVFARRRKTVLAMCSPSRPSLMTMKTSCISRWSKRVQHFSTPALTEPFAWLVSSETTGAICALWLLFWGCVTRFSRGVVGVPATVGNERSLCQ